MDVVKFLSTTNTVNMRYTKSVKQFWRLGYKIFKMKFVSFMGGYKNQGKVVPSYERYDPVKAKINFVVSNLK